MLATQSEAAQRVADMRSRVMDLNSALLTELARLPTDDLDPEAHSFMSGAVVKMQGAANDLGLFAEMAAPGDLEPIGNLPQALSHVGLVNAAWRLREAGDSPM